MNNEAIEKTVAMAKITDELFVSEEEFQFIVDDIRNLLIDTINIFGDEDIPDEKIASMIIAMYKEAVKRALAEVFEGSDVSHETVDQLVELYNEAVSKVVE